MSVVRDLMDIYSTFQSGRKKKDSSKTTSSGSPGPTNDMGDWAGSFKRGGKVRKTGIAKVHKGEYVLTAKQAKRRGRKSR